MHRTRKLCLPDQELVSDPRVVFRALCQDAADEIQCDLVSVWLFDRNQTQIQCQACLDVPANTFTDGQVLRREDFPTYFEHLLEESIISVAHATSHPWTEELNADYFDPLGVKSLLDFVLHDGASSLGVICCENRAMVKNWTEAHACYLRSLTAVASRYFRIKRNVLGG